MRANSGRKTIPLHADYFEAGLTVIGFTLVDDNAFLTLTAIATMTPTSAITPMTTAASSPVVRFVSERRHFVKSILVKPDDVMLQ